MSQITLLQLTFFTSPRSVTLHNDTIMVHHDHQKKGKYKNPLTNNITRTHVKLTGWIVAGDAFSIRVIQSAFFCICTLFHIHTIHCASGTAQALVSCPWIAIPVCTFKRGANHQLSNPPYEPRLPHRVIDLLIFSFQHISKPLQFYLYRAKSVQQLSEGTLHYK